MELDEFKQRLKERTPEIAILHSAGELERYIHKRARSVINNIKRSILFELVACVIFVAVAAFAWLSYPVSYLRAFSVLSVFLSFFLFIYLAALYKKINEYEVAASTVKNTLQRVIDIITQFTRAYFQFTMVTLPVTFVFGLIAGFFNIHSEGGIKNFNWHRAMFFYTGLFIFWSVLVYFFSKWYIKKLYGKYLQQLKEQLKDIENG